MTQDLLRRPTGGAHLHDPAGPVIPVSAPPLPPPAAAVHPAEAVPAVQPPDLPAVPPSPFDPDATVVIGRHRRDGTRDTAAAAALPPPPSPWRFVGRVAAGAVALFRRRGSGR